jgi:hypothetical protein
VGRRFEQEVAVSDPASSLSIRALLVHPSSDEKRDDCIPTRLDILTEQVSRDYWVLLVIWG